MYELMQTMVADTIFAQVQAGCSPTTERGNWLWAPILLCFDFFWGGGELLFVF